MLFRDENLGPRVGRAGGVFAAPRGSPRPSKMLPSGVYRADAIGAGHDKLGLALGAGLGEEVWSLVGKLCPSSSALLLSNSSFPALTSPRSPRLRPDFIIVRPMASFAAG